MNSFHFSPELLNKLQSRKSGSYPSTLIEGGIAASAQFRSTIINKQTEEALAAEHRAQLSWIFEYRPRD